MRRGDQRSAAGFPSTRDLVRRYPVAAFYLLLLALTWPLMAVLGDTVLTYVALALLGPSGCALVVVGTVGGRATVVAQLRRVLVWRAPAWTWLYAVAGNGLLVVGVPVAVVYLFGDGNPAWQPAPLLVTVAVNLLFLLVVPGLTEEIGWRGLCLPRVQARAGPVAASLVVGLLWAVWHYPLVILREGGVTTVLGWFTVGVVGASFVYTWLYNASGGNVLLAVTLHAAENAWTGSAFVVLFGAEHDLAFTVRQATAAAIAVVLVVATRGALGRRAASGPGPSPPGVTARPG